MKFKKLLSWSLPVIMYGTVLISAGFSADRTENTDSNAIPESVPTATTVPELKVQTDTVYVTKEDFYGRTKCFVGGLYKYKKAAIVRYNYIPDTDDTYINRWCRVQNENSERFLHHEMEHARKAAMVHNTVCYNPYVRSRIAAMDEIQAYGSEVVYLSEYYRQNGDFGASFTQQWRDVIRRINEITDSVSGKSAPIDFSQNEIANIVLFTGFDKYRSAVSNGMYTKRIVETFNESEICIAYHNRIYKKPDVTLFNPTINEWGPMFSYETYTGRNVSSWNNASESMRQYVLTKVDSIIDANLSPAQIAQKPQIPYFGVKSIKCL